MQRGGLSGKLCSPVQSCMLHLCWLTATVCGLLCWRRRLRLRLLYNCDSDLPSAELSACSALCGHMPAPSLSPTLDASGRRLADPKLVNSCIAMHHTGRSVLSSMQSSCPRSPPWNVQSALCRTSFDPDKQTVCIRQQSDEDDFASLTPHASAHP